MRIGHEYNNNYLLCKKITIMTWQEILVGIILCLAVYFLYKKFSKKDNNCEENGCDCS